MTTALIVGNGFIGVELSLLLADLGVDVSIVGRRNWVMPRVLDPMASTLAEAALVAAHLRLGFLVHEPQPLARETVPQADPMRSAEGLRVRLAALGRPMRMLAATVSSNSNES